MKAFDEAARERIAAEMKRALGSRSQTWLAEQLGVDQTAVSSWLRGRTTPRVERFAEIELVLGLPEGRLWQVATGAAPQTNDEAVMSPLLGKLGRLSQRDRRAVERLIDDLLEGGEHR